MSWTGTWRRWAGTQDGLAREVPNGPEEARDRRRRRRPRRWRPEAEGLEGRALLSAVAGVDYTLSGYQWANPTRITYSIAPDGVTWDHGINVLNATFNAKFGAGNWERTIAKDLATWESVANINIVPVSDSPLPFDTPGLSQGDPRFGDIRFGGYPFLNDTTTLAQTYYPPPNGLTAAGDVEVNTAIDFNNGSQYDLYSVLLHETGHSLGMAHATNPAEVMYPVYQGVVSGLSPGDIAGIQAIYGPRTADAYQSQGQGLAPGSAIDLTGGLGTTDQVTLGGVSLATIGDTEYFSVVAPDDPGATLQVTAAASNISLLSPQVTVYDTAGHDLGTAANPSAWSDDVSTSVSQVVPGTRYIIAVTGATQDVFAVGAYQLGLAFTGGTAPPASTPSPAPIATPAPSPTTIGPVSPAPAPSSSSDSTITSPTPTPTPVPVTPTVVSTNLGTLGATTLGGLSLTPAGTIDDFHFTAARAGVYQVNATGTSIIVRNAAGTTIASGQGSVMVRVPRARTAYTVEVSPPDGSGTTTTVASYTLTIGPAGAAGPATVRPGRAWLGAGIGAGMLARRQALAARLQLLSRLRAQQIHRG